MSLPAGHTASCIQKLPLHLDRRPGPALRPGLARHDPASARSAGPGGRLVGDGRPIWVTDLRDPENPVVAEEPIDLWRNDGYTDYSHDVDEDERGIAWVSGRGGIRGYATRGRHRDPYQNRWRRATPFDPVLVAGGGVAGTAQPDDVHAQRGPADGRLGTRRGRRRAATCWWARRRTSRTPCGASGQIVLSDITSSLGGEPAQQSTLAAPFRMPALDTFHPFIDTPETANPDLGCSAHYFEIEGSTLGAAWYGQGLRLLDISDARDVRQVGFYRVTGTTPADGENPSSNSWDLAFKQDRRREYAYLFDMNRGVEVLRIRGGTARSARMKSVTAPSVKVDRFASRPVSSLVRTSSAANGGTRFVCPLFT